MNPKHLIFVKGMLKHGNAMEAYCKAYPTAAPESCRTAAARLLADPEIKQMIDTANATARAELKTELKQMAKERQAAELMDLHERRKVLAQMVRGEIKYKRHLKVNGEVVEVEDDLSPFALLRAIELDAKLAEDWYAAPVRAERLSQTPKPEQQPPEEPYETHPGDKGYLSIGYPEDGDTNINRAKERVWEDAHPSIVSRCSGLSRDGELQSTINYAKCPPWTDNPAWYDQQPTPPGFAGPETVTICNKSQSGNSAIGRSGNGASIR